MAWVGEAFEIKIEQTMEAGHQYKRMRITDKLVKTKRSKEQQGKEAHIPYLPCSALTSSLKKHTFYNLLINNILYLCVT